MCVGKCLSRSGLGGVLPYMSLKGMCGLIGYGFQLKDPSQARLYYCFDLKFAIKLLVGRDKTSTVQLVKI